ncbi:CPBP family intramembrane glutamic endopeptidase [Catalinimonas niigatensis]|uniref:CPBP family intramembrane glutamic endopeptidase n=1 Tax=Catalinimonas niigatensis TaxID=1397264 RepID=UPI002666B749|nr:CPBP family intramembrane glutamic endopeptidase [Catalinimonas niigatensis]WPP51166.1 CPBP family intramembrane glutamic endopeptidase [Catalinimonas niigatensis]
MNKTFILGMSTLLIFGVGGYCIVEVIQKRSFAEVWLQGMGVPTQLGIGIGYGLLISLLALWIISRDFFKTEKMFYRQLISQLDLNIGGVLFLSLCAGIAEEIFFRAGLQPLLGLWLTSVLFVFIHGYLNPYNWRLSIYGAAMVFFIAGMGYLFQEVGLISAIAAHTVLDIVLFASLSGRNE